MNINNMTDITLTIHYNLGFSKGKRTCFALDLDRCPLEQRAAFTEKLELGSKACDPSFRFLNTPSNEIRRIMANREKVAKQITHEMVHFLMTEFARDDTMDGYTRKEQEQFDE